MMTVTTQPKESQATRTLVGFAALLRQDREEAGMSLELLAHKMETSPSYLFRLEKGMAANPGRNFTIRLGIMLYRDDIERLDQLLKAAGHLPLMTSRGRTNAG
jgi:transcriptional regulator with XRE-family HTH domain